MLQSKYYKKDDLVAIPLNLKEYGDLNYSHFIEYYANDAFLFEKSNTLLLFSDYCIFKNNDLLAITTNNKDLMHLPLTIRNDRDIYIDFKRIITTEKTNLNNIIFYYSRKYLKNPADVAQIEAVKEYAFFNTEFDKEEKSNKEKILSLADFKISNEVGRDDLGKVYTNHLYPFYYNLLIFYNNSFLPLALVLTSYEYYKTNNIFDLKIKYGLTNSVDYFDSEKMMEAYGFYIINTFVMNAADLNLKKRILNKIKSEEWNKIMKSSDAMATLYYAIFQYSKKFNLLKKLSVLFQDVIKNNRGNLSDMFNNNLEFKRWLNIVASNKLDLPKIIKENFKEINWDDYRVSEKEMDYIKKISYGKVEFAKIILE